MEKFNINVLWKIYITSNKSCLTSINAGGSWMMFELNLLCHSGTPVEGNGFE